MAEETTKSVTPAETTENTEPKSEDKPSTDWKAEARKWESRAKENKGAADELAQLKESQLSELEKAQKEAADAKAKAETLEAEKLRIEFLHEAAKTAGVDFELLSLMTGNTPEEITANAKLLKAKLSAIPAYPSVEDNGAGSAAAITREDIQKIKDPATRVRMIAENRALFT